jgi:putative PEP-CTERM system TPR-repeat lipoprotein
MKFAKALALATVATAAIVTVTPTVAAVPHVPVLAPASAPPATEETRAAETSPVLLQRVAAAGEDGVGASDVPLALSDPAVADDRVSDVVGQLRQQNFDKALLMAQALEEERPGSALPLHLQALALWGKDQRSQAIQRLEDAHRLAPRDFGVSYDLARFYRSAGQPEAAREVVETALEGHPDSTRMKLEAARIYGSLGDRETMRRQLTEILEIDPSVIEARVYLARLQMLSGDGEQAIRTVRSAPDQQAGVPELLEALGQAQLVVGQPGKAAATFERLTTVAPDEPGAYLAAGQAHLANGDPAKAATLLGKAHTLAPDSKPIQLTLAEARIRSGEGEKAEQLVAELEDAYPNDAEVVALRGRYAFAVDGDAEAAERAYRRALDLQASEQLAVRLAQLQLHRGRADAATETLQSWIAAHPESRLARQAAGEIQLGRGDYAGAVQTYGQLVELSPGNAGYLNNLAWSQAETGALNDALTSAEKAAAAAPNQPAILDTLGSVLLKLKRTDAAVATLRKAVDLAPDRGDIRLTYAEALAAAGQTEKARAELRRISGNVLPQSMEQRRLSLADRLSMANQ